MKHFVELMQRAVSENPAVREQARPMLATALELPIKEAIFPGDLFSDLFTIEKRGANDEVKYPTDLIVPGRERDFSAYAIPMIGGLPERIVVNDYIRVPTYEHGNTIELPLSAVERGDYNMVKRALEVLEAGIVMKMNDDAWRLLIRSAAARNLIALDTGALPGALSRRLVSNMQTWMRRYAGGNSSSMNKFRLRRLYMSPELRASIVSWTNADADEVTRREISMNEEGRIAGLLETEFRDIDELGAGQVYQNYFSTTLGGTLPTYTYTGSGGGSKTKTELLVGVDTAKRDRLVMPVTKEPVVKEDPSYERRGLMSWFTRFNFGTGCLDNRTVLLGAA